jgi:hypothetical protein
MLLGIFDGNWIDELTIAGGIAGIFAKPSLRKIYGKPPCWVHRDVINDFLNSASLAPFRFF